MTEMYHLVQYSIKLKNLNLKICLLFLKKLKVRYYLQYDLLDCRISCAYNRSVFFKL